MTLSPHARKRQRMIKWGFASLPIGFFVGAIGGYFVGSIVAGVLVGTALGLGLAVWLIVGAGVFFPPGS